MHWQHGGASAMRRKGKRAYFEAECRVFSAMLGGHIKAWEYHARLRQLQLVYGVTT
jgi:hypothetical protein